MTDVAALGWIEWGALAAALVAMERLFSWMERRGWIYWRGLRQEGDRPELRLQPLPLHPHTSDQSLTLARIVQGQSPHNWPTLAPDATCGHALKDLRRATLPARIVCFYVLERDGSLAGVVSTRRLLSADSATRVSDLMTRDVVALPAVATLQAAVEALLGRTMLAVLVVDGNRRLIGVVDIHLVAAECRRWKGRSGSSMG